MLYVAAAIGGTGAGAVYGTCVGNSLKWFPDRRGLAAGLTAMGFGAGSALTVVPIQALIHSHGYEAAFFWFGIGQGAIVMLIALFLLAPKKGEVPAALIVPYTSVLTTMTGSWHAVFLAAAALNIVAALMAIFVLKPMRKGYVRSADEPAAARRRPGSPAPRKARHIRPEWAGPNIGPAFLYRRARAPDEQPAGRRLSRPPPFRDPGRERCPDEEGEAEEAERQREDRDAAHDGAVARADADPVAAGKAGAGAHRLDARHDDAVAELARRRGAPSRRSPRRWRATPRCR